MKIQPDKKNHVYLMIDITFLLAGLIVGIFQMLEIHNIVALLLTIWFVIRTPNYKILSLISVLCFLVASLFLFIKRQDAASAAAIIGFYSLCFSIILLILKKK